MILWLNKTSNKSTLTTTAKKLKKKQLQLQQNGKPSITNATTFTNEYKHKYKTLLLTLYAIYAHTYACI